MEPSSMVVGAPFQVWTAPTGTAFPLITATPGVAWEQLGINGNKSMHEDGITVRHPQTVNRIRPLGSTGPIKAVRADEDMEIEFTLLDLTLEAYSAALSQQTVVDTGGEKTLAPYRGFTIPEVALLARGPSPYDETLNMQYEIPRAYTEGAPEVVFVKADVAGLQFLFVALSDPDADEGEEFGRIVAGDPTLTS